jgi:hypothetical protein
MLNYHSQQPAFDWVDNITVSFFENVLFLGDYVGLTIVLWVLAAHFVVMATLIVMFVRDTRSTLLGKAWSALAQVLESQEVEEHIVGASEKTDSEISKELQKSQQGGLRARVEHRGGSFEVVR